MISLLNPYVLLGIVLAVFSAFSGGYWKGSEAEIEKQQLEIAKLNAEARQKEQALVAAVNTQAVQLVKANNEARVQIKKRDADIAAGVIRLRIPVSCPVQTSGDAPVASGANLGTAELQPATAQAVLAVGDDADATTRKLNTCITLYNQVRETLKGQK
jgi:hypothetical protein